MSRLYRTRIRVTITVLVLAIVIGAYVEYRRTRRANRTEPVASAAPTTRPSSIAKPPAAHPAGDGVLALYATAPQPTPVAAPAPAVEPAPAVPAAHVLDDAKLKINAGDLLAARKLLNDALLAGTLSDADAAAVKKQLADVNNVLLFSNRLFPNDPLGGTYKVAAGDRLAAIAKADSVPFELLMQLNHLSDPRKLRSGQTLKVVHGPFFAVVTKGRYVLDVYLGDTGGPGSTYVTTFPVGLGENNHTPTGLWTIKNKAASPAYYSPRGEGVIPAGDPKNPLGPFWLGLEGTDGDALGAVSYGIHGTIDPSSIGKQASMGCIRLRNDDVTVLYRLLVEGKSKVKVVD
jgi:lipoprotein-anchoring transpeptidase ErfK/SrfK